MVRVRRNEPGKQFSTVSQISYRPAMTTTNCRESRFSGSLNSLFYAASCERRLNGKPSTLEAFGLRVGIFETLDELRENHKYGLGSLTREDIDTPPLFRVRTPRPPRDVLVTYGVWEVTTSLTLVNAAPTRSRDGDWGESQISQRLLGNWILQDPFARVGQDDFWRLVGDSFASTGGGAYAFSLLLAEELLRIGFDGLSYPSSRCDGYGLNMAISPDSVDRKLRCVKVAMARVSTSDRELVITTSPEVILTENVSRFELSVPPG